MARPSLAEEIGQELGKRHLRDFVRESWSIVEPAKPYIHGWHVDAICDHLQAVTNRQIQRLLITVPPGHAKSLIVCVFWPAHNWAQDTDHISGGPRWRGLFSSYAGELAIRDSIRCRALVESDWYRRGYRIDRSTGQLKWSLSGDQNVKSYFENTEKGFRISLSVGGKGTGFRGDAIVVDDPLNAKDQYSDSARREVTFWWDNVMSSRLNDLSIGAKVIIQQRLHACDLAGHVLEQGGYEHLNLPSEFEPERRAKTFIFSTPLMPASHFSTGNEASAPGDAPDPAGSDGAKLPDKVEFFTDPRKNFGELLFPALFPRPVLVQAKKDMGSTSYAGQHQQRPSAEEGGILKRHWWRYWQPVGANMPPVLVRKPDGDYQEVRAIELDLNTLDETLQSWDCAFKDLATSDFVVGLVMGVRKADRFLLDCLRDRLDLPRTIRAVKGITAKWPRSTRKLVEDKANGPAVVQSLRGEIVGLVEVNPEGGKIARASAASPEVESGNWYLPHPNFAPWVQAFIDECSDFPNGANDDQVDAWSQGALKIGSLGQFGLLDLLKQREQQAAVERETLLQKIRSQNTGEPMPEPPAKVEEPDGLQAVADAVSKSEGVDDAIRKFIDERSVDKVAKPADLVKPATADQTLRCPQCGNAALARVANSWRCSQCGHQFGFSGGSEARPGGRADLMKRR